ncbi:MAG: hypothetical protein ACRCYO_03700 [Bacteroidia bacterium]
MMHLRTNRPLSIGELLNQAILPYTVVDGQVIAPSAASSSATPAASHQVEEGGPVRPTERVPYSSSHKFAPAA